MKSLLLSEIFEQPAAFQHFLDAETRPVGEIMHQLRSREFRYLFITARGSSDNAARYGQYLFGVLNHLPVALAAPSLFTRYHCPPQVSNALVIGISQSGLSPDIIEVIAEARRQGAATVAITNDQQSPLAQAAEHTIALHVGDEQSIAATKTYTAQLGALALLSINLAQKSEETQNLAAIPASMEKALCSEPQAEFAARALASSDRAVVIGRGFNYATAFEIALKIKELAYVGAEPYSSADFQHGPIALAEKGFPAVLISLSETFRAEMDALKQILQQRGARLVWLSDEMTEEATHEFYLPIPPGLPEWLTPLVAVIPGQLLAYHLARARGFDPDQPRTLQKVTLTR